MGARHLGAEPQRLDPPAVGAGDEAPVAAEEHVENHADAGDQHEDQHPGQRGRGIALLVDEREHDAHDNRVEENAEEPEVLDRREAHTPSLRFSDLDELDLEREVLPASGWLKSSVTVLLADLDDYRGDALALGTGELDGPTHLGCGRERVERELLQPLVVVLAVGLSGRNRHGDLVAGLQAEDRLVEAGDDLARADVNSSGSRPSLLSNSVPSDRVPR